MCEELVKFYERESQADSDAIKMMQDGWLKIGNLSYSYAARMWRQEWVRPCTLPVMAERMVVA